MRKPFGHPPGGEREWLYDVREMPLHRWSDEAEDAGLNEALFGNLQVKVMAEGTGTVFPYLLTDAPLAICGMPGHPERGGGGRLFVEEGGVVRPVVGPQSPRFDAGDVEDCSLYLSATSQEKRFAVGDLRVAQRVIAPLSGLPALVVLYDVENVGAGSRWLTLHDVWDISPHFMGADFARPSLRQRLSAALRSEDEEWWDNRYLTSGGRRSGSRVEVVFSWDEARARKLIRAHTAPQVPEVQLAALTRNVTFPSPLHAALRAVLPALPAGKGAPELRRVTATVKFQAQPERPQTAAMVLWFGPWQEARKALRTLLPLNLLDQNEALLWRRRSPFQCAPRDLEHKERHAWAAGHALSRALVAPWRSRDRGRYFLVPGGEKTFAHGVYDSPTLRGSLLQALPLANPPLARDLTLDGLRRVVSRVNRLDQGETVDAFFLTDLAWNLLALGRLVGVAGWRPQKEEEELCRTFFDEVTDVLSRAELYGANDCLTTRFADPVDDAHRRSGVPPRSQGAVETVAGTALLVTGLQVAGEAAGGWAPEGGHELLTLADIRRQALLSLAEEGRFPRFLMRGEPLLPERTYLDHLPWLLAMGIPDDLQARLLDASYAHLLGGAGGILPRWRSGGEEGPREKLTHAAWVAVLGARRPAWAEQLYQRLWVEEASGDQPARPLPTNPRQEGLSYFGAVSRVMAQAGLLGIRVQGGVLTFRMDLLDKVSLESTVLQVRLSGRRVSGNWNGLLPTSRIRVTHAEGWRIAAGATEVSSSADMLLFDVKRGEPWALERIEQE